MNGAKIKGGLMKNTLENEILTLLEDVDRLGHACKDLESKIKRLRLDIEAQLNAKKEMVNDDTRRQND